MLVGAMGLTASGAAMVFTANVGRVAPFPALLANGDADLRGSAANEAFAVGSSKGKGSEEGANTDTDTDT
jgi:hypothetical protein